MKRGDIVVAAVRGHYMGKPRPAVVVQSDLLNPTHASCLLAPLTTELIGLSTYRVTVAPIPGTGLAELSEIMVDKIAAVPRVRIGQTIGVLPAALVIELDRAIAVVLGIS